MSLRRKTIEGLWWSFGARILRQISQFIVMAILARLLNPDDFGLLGMITVFFGFALIFGEFGFSAALIQNNKVDNKHFSSVFWLNIFLGIMLSLSSYLTAHFIADFYVKPVLTDLIKVISITFFVKSFSIVPFAYLQKRMDFRALAVSEFTAVVIAGMIGVCSALLGMGVWSLGFYFMGFYFVHSCMLWIFCSWRPLSLFSWDAIKEILSFSLNITGFNIVEYFARNIDYLLIGKFLGAGALGIYTLAYKIMLYPLRNISHVIEGVMFPAFSKIQHDLEKVRINYLRMIRAISLVTFPLMLGLVVVAPEFIRVVFGAQWEGAVAVLRIFCFCGMAQSLETTVGNIFRSQGRSDIHLKLQAAGTFVISVFIIIGLRWGIKGVAFSYTLCTFLLLPFTFHFSNKLINLKTKLFFLSIIPAIAVSASIAVVLVFMKSLIKTTDLNILLFSVVCAVFVYFIQLIFTKQIIVSKNSLKLNI